MFLCISTGICQFGLAHVDTPKGDLDASSGKLTGPDTNVAVNDFVYRFGTTEQYPATTDIAGNVLTNTAHEYRECSNKGHCDRSTGTCACFEGYEGSACQRASCPVGPNGMCSGHGVCETISEIANRDWSNIYKLWDEDTTMGCVCDSGYTGADCSARSCKVGTDPLYFDNNATLRYSNFTYQFVTDLANAATVTGNYSLVFFDHSGEDWESAPISISATCADIQTALEYIPNNVIATGSVRCYKNQLAGTGVNGQSAALIEPIRDANMYVHAKYTLAFPRNPGKLRQITINKFLDGARPTLYTDEDSTEGSSLQWHIYPNGFIGEDVDLVPDRCHGVIASVRAGDEAAYLGTHYLYNLNAAEIKLLKTCLGDANGDDSDNQDVYNWDYGSESNPHLIKLQDATQFTSSYSVDSNGDIIYDPQLQSRPRTLLCDSASYNTQRFGSNGGIPYCHNRNAPGFYSVLYYEPSAVLPFRLFTRASQDYDSATPFYIYTTKGYLNQVSAYAGVYTTHSTHYSTHEKISSRYSNQVHMINTDSTYAVNSFRGDMSCENNAVGVNGASDCINKGDMVMILEMPATDASTVALNDNPVYPNIYTVEKIYRARRSNVTSTPDSINEVERLSIVLDYSMNAAYGETAPAYVYKFYPSTANADGGYRHTAPCGTRGVCNEDNGLCECFHGYGLDDCSCNTCNRLTV